VLGRQVGIHAHSTTFILTFSTAMNAASVENVNNYELRGPNGRLDPIALAIYSSSTNSVTLRTKVRLNSHRYYRLEVYAQGSEGVKSKAGVALDRMKSGQPGNNYFATVYHLNLTPSLP
jgi:Bacterial Ig-like domain